MAADARQRAAQIVRPLSITVRMPEVKRSIWSSRRLTFRATQSNSSPISWTGRRVAYRDFKRPSRREEWCRWTRGSPMTRCAVRDAEIPRARPGRVEVSSGPGGRRSLYKAVNGGRRPSWLAREAPRSAHEAKSLACEAKSLTHEAPGLARKALSFACKAKPCGRSPVPRSRRFRPPARRLRC